MQVLERIEAALAETLRQAEREPVPAAPPADAAARDAVWQGAFARLDDRLAALDDCAARAARAAAGASAALADAAGGLDRWRKAADSWPQGENLGGQNLTRGVQEVH
jgi:hypothetical protein